MPLLRKLCELIGSVDRKNIYIFAVTLFFVALLLAVNFVFLYSYQKQKILLEGRNSTSVISSEFRVAINPLVLLAKITAYKVNYLEEHAADNKLLPADVSSFLKIQTSVYAQNVDDSFTGIYGWFDNEFVDGEDWTPPEGYNPVERPWYRTAVQNPDQIAFVDPYLDSLTNKIVMTVVTTLKNKNNVLAMDFLMDKIQRKLEDLSQDDGFDHMIVNRKGLVISHSNINMVGKVFDISGGQAGSIEEYVIKYALDDTSSENGVLIDYNDDTYVVYCQSIGSGWFVVGIADADEVFSSLKITIAVSVLSIIIFLIVVVAIFLNTFMKQRNIQRLNENMTMVAEIYDSMYEISLSANNCRHLCSSGQKTATVLGEVVEDAQRYIVTEMEKLAVTSSKADIDSFADISTLPERLRGRRSLIAEFMNCDGLWNRARFVASDFQDSSGALDKVLLLIENIDGEKRERAKLIYLSETDHLTGISNRRSGETHIMSLMSGEQYGMFAIFDADRFKSVNDNYGHAVGDKVIIAIADCLRQTFESYGVVMRLGGDEFAVYALSVTDRKTAADLMGRFFRRIDDIEIRELRDFRICISVGATFSSAERECSFDSLFKEADAAAYESKKVQGNFLTFAGSCFMTMTAVHEV